MAISMMVDGTKHDAKLVSINKNGTKTIVDEVRRNKSGISQLVYAKRYNASDIEQVEIEVFRVFSAIRDPDGEDIIEDDTYSTYDIGSNYVSCSVTRSTTYETSANLFYRIWVHTSDGNRINIQDNTNDERFESIKSFNLNIRNYVTISGASSTYDYWYLFECLESFTYENPQSTHSETVNLLNGPNYSSKDYVGQNYIEWPPNYRLTKATCRTNFTSCTCDSLSIPIIVTNNI